MHVTDWMKMDREEVMEKFASLDGSTYNGLGNTAFCYVPGDRKDRVLLVAHADTVFQDRQSHVNKIAPVVNGDVVSSGNPILGIGADDRAGCAIVWALRKLGHSLLIVTGEESGCLGSRWMVSNEDWNYEINKRHNFAVQFDRHGSNDLVFYDVGTQAFSEYCSKSTGFKPAQGSYTDIAQLCKEICGVNMSVGYYNEHTVRETLLLSEWQRTLNVAKRWLSQHGLPKFELPKKFSGYGSYGNWNGYGGRNNWDDDDAFAHLTVGRSKVDEAALEDRASHILAEQDEINLHDDHPTHGINSVACLFCKTPNSLQEVKNNDNLCSTCGAEIPQ